MNDTGGSARALALFAVLLVGKAIAISIVGPPPLGEWYLLLGGDALVALGYGAFAELVQRRAATGVVYALACAFSAVTALCIHAIGSPPSAPMMAGIDGAMRDSIALYQSPRFLLPGLLVVACATCAPYLVRAASTRVTRAGAAVLVASTLPYLLVGPPSLPAHRNPLLFFLGTLQSGGTGAEARVASTHATHALSALRRARLGSDEPAPLADLHGAGRGMNVVVVVLESAAARHLGVHGNLAEPMPFLADIAATGVVFDAAYAVYPESIKGQIALFHSVHPAPRTEAAQYARIPTRGVAASFGGAGYRTAIMHAGRFRFLGMEDVLARSGFEHRVDAADISGIAESSFGVDEESVVDAALDWVNGCDKPFFLAYLPIAGHHPYESPPGGSFPYDTELGCYSNALEYADHALARLWEGVRASGLAQKTVLVVIGDHGQAFGEHDGNYGHTFFAYEENLRVPFVICVPDAPHRRVRVPVSHVDLAPTLLELAGLEHRSDFEGTGLCGAAPSSVLFFADWGATLVGVREGAHKIIHDMDTGRTLLFDLDADPDERHDIAAREPVRAARLREVVRDFFPARAAEVRGW